MEINSLLGAALLSALSCVVAVVLTWRFNSPGSFFYVLDHPNERSLHARPTPRTGGIAVLSAIVVAGVAAALMSGEYPVEWLGLLGAGALLAAVSLVDDRIGVPVSVRLLTHVAVAAWVITAGIGPGAPYAAYETVRLLAPVCIALAFLFVVWMINLYNFMDGMDGFAGGMAIIGFGAFALLGWLAGNGWFAVSNLIVASAAGGFLIFNFPPARIFLGDAGSTTLGLLAAGFSLWAHRDGLFPIWIAMLVFSPFIVDATVTLTRRLLRGEKVWHAHKTHYYQRLVQSGWGHRRTVLWEYALMMACAGTAVWATRQDATVQWTAIGVWVLVYLALSQWVDRSEKAIRH